MDRLRVTQVNDVLYIDRFDGKAHVRGTLHLTLTHIFFLGSSRKQEIWLHNQLILDVEKLPLSTGGAPLVIYGKNFRIIHLILQRERDCHEVFTTIKELKSISSITSLSCFHLVPLGCQWDRSLGWDANELRAQYERFGLPNTWWKLTDINSNFEICDTYPKLLCVPTDATQSMLRASSRFRSRGRIPVLTYYHPLKKSSLCRSSQPLAGFSSKSTEDQLLLEAIRLASPSPSPMLYVVDTRPALNALTNRAQGKGYEDVTVYRNIVIQFFDIENIHVVRNSLKKLLRVIEDPASTVENFISGIDQSGWLRHLRCILEAAYFVAARLNEGKSVLVHCSDGWDRTTQVCSLAQIILDPYYRSLTGFENLIKKEWLHFGHKFSDRCGQITLPDPRELSPIFTQFLDCVRHLCDLCPTEFEFNSNLLCLLHDEAYAAQYGTFVGCSESERERLGVRDSTYSVWPLIWRNAERFKNPYYKHASAFNMTDVPSPVNYNGATIPNGVDLSINDSNCHLPTVDPLPTFVLAPQLFRLWRGLYLRWEWRLPKPERQFAGAISDLVQGLQTLTSHNRLMTARISQLCTLLGKPVSSVLPRLSNGDLIALSPQKSSKLSPLTDDDMPVDVFHSTGDESFAPSVCPLTSDRSDNPRVSLAPLSCKQLKTELDSVSTNWTNIGRQDVACSNCGIFLALVDLPVHCHVCGSVICLKCVNPKPRTIAGLSYPQLHKICICQNCGPSSDKKLLPPQPTNSTSAVHRHQNR